MTDHGLFADAEDAGSLAGGLAAGRPEHAFALPLGQRRPPDIGACPDELPRRGERDGADDLSGVEHLERNPGIGSDGKGAASGSFAGQVPRHREAVADSALAGDLQQLPVAAGERDVLVDIAPLKARHGFFAGAPDRVGAAEIEADIDIRPGVGIIMHEH